MLDFGPTLVLLTPPQAFDSPSIRRSVPLAVDKALRFYACEVIQEAGILMRMPQAVMSTAQVLLHRFFFKQSFLDFDALCVAASCFWLSVKLEEEGASNRGERPSRLNDLVMVFQRICSQRKKQARSTSFPTKENILKLERRILIDLGFACHVEHPHKFLLSYLNQLEVSPEVVQESWNLVNDILRSVLCVLLPSNVLACGAIYAASRRLCIPLPENPPWWSVFDVSFEQIMEVCHALADLYRQPKAQYIDCRHTICPEESVLGSSHVSSLKSIGSPVTESLTINVSRQPIDDCKRDVSACLTHSESLNCCALNASGVQLSKDTDTEGDVVQDVHRLARSGMDGNSNDDVGANCQSKQSLDLDNSGDIKPLKSDSGADIKLPKSGRFHERWAYDDEFSSRVNKRDAEKHWHSDQSSARTYHHKSMSKRSRHHEEAYRYEPQTKRSSRYYEETHSQSERSSGYYEDRRHNYNHSWECIRA